MADDIRLVEFDEEAHEYTYRGRTLKGVTAQICALMGKAYPIGNARVELAASYGSQVHKEVERHYMDGVPVMTDGAKYAVQVLEEEARKHNAHTVKCEQRVSDFVGTASNVDIVLYTPNGAVLYDIKTGEFNRTYCTLQLNAYRIMFEKCYGIPVIGMGVIATKHKRLYVITKGREEEVALILARNAQ